MSHWAQIDNENKVIQVLVGPNDGDEGYAFFTETIGGTWIKTSINTYGGVHSQGGTPLRKNYAGIGYTYDVQRDAFIPPKPEGEGWSLNETTCLWENEYLHS